MSNKLSLIVNFLGVDRMSGALRSIIGLGRQGGRSLGEMRAEGRRLEAQLRAVRREIAEGTGDIEELTQRERELREAMAGVNDEMRRRARENAINARRQQDLANAQALQDKGKDNMTQGAALAAPLILATKAAADFSSGMVDIQQKAGLTNAQTERLAQNILTLSNRARQMPEDMRAGLDLLLSKGMALDAAQAAIGPAGRIATAYKVEIPDAAGAAYAAINNLKVPASQTARILDMMAAAGNEGAFEVRNMARHFPALTAQMQALGEVGAPAVADLSAALQVAMNTAGSEDEAANNIQNLLAKINAPGTIAAFKKNFGVDLPAAMAKLTAEGYSSLEAIALITQKATGGDMKRLGFAFEDQQARMGIMALIQNLQEYRRVREAAMNSGGTVDKAFAQRTARDATVNWRAFLASASALAITLGTTLLPVATEAMNMIGGLANSVTAWAQANPAAAATLVKAVAALAVFKIGLGAAQFAIGGFMKPLANLNAFIARIGGWKHVLGTAKVGFDMLRVGIMFLAKGVLRAGVMMMANPIVLAITLIVVAIAGAAYLIYTHWDTIKAAFWSAVAAVGGALGRIWQVIQSAFSAWVGLHVRAIEIGKNIISGLVSGIMSAPGRVWAALKSIVMGAIGNVKGLLGIKSPSRVFMAIGAHTGEGMAIGIDRQRKRVAGAAGGLAKGAAAAGALALAPTALAAQPAGGMGAGGASAAPITINIYQQPGEDMAELARRVGEELKRAQAGAARRSYEDSN